MKLDKTKIDELKAGWPDGIFEGEIAFTDGEDVSRTVEFVYRRPNMADIESHAKSSGKNGVAANLNLLQSLIVHPEPGPVIEAIRDFPMATNKFVEEAVVPFFGANVAVRKRRL